MKWILGCILAKAGLVTLIAQDAPPQPAVPEPPAPDGVPVPAPDAVPPTNTVPATNNIVAATNTVSATNVIAATNVVAVTNVVAATEAVPATNAVVASEFVNRPMSADEERNAREILRNLKVKPSPSVPDAKDYFDSTYVIFPAMDDKEYIVVHGKPSASVESLARSSGTTPDSNSPKVAEKSKRKQKRQKEIAATATPQTPADASTNPEAPVVAGAPESQPFPDDLADKPGDEEYRRKEIERIEAEVIKAAEARKQREAAAAAEAATTSPLAPAQPVPPATPATPATNAVAAAAPAPAGTPVVPMTADQEAKARAILDSKSGEFNNQLAPSNPTAGNVDTTAKSQAQQVEEARQRAYAEALRVKDERAHANDTAGSEVLRKKEAEEKEIQDRLARIRAESAANDSSRTSDGTPAAVPAPTPVVQSPTTPTPNEQPPAADPYATRAAAPPTEGQPPSDAEAKARAILEKAIADTNPPVASVTNTLAAPASLPTEAELKAEAKARRAREKAAAEEARIKLREEQRQLAAQADEEKKAQALAKAEQRRLEKEAKQAKAAEEKRAKEEAKRAADAEAKALKEAKKNAAKAPAVTKSDVPGDVKPAAKPGEAVVRSWEISNGKTKEQRLSELMDAYARDLISASEYHKARASIVNEP